MKSAISETGLKKDTIRRRLALENLAGLRSYCPVLKPKLNETHKEKRLQWAKDNVRWSQLQWRNVLFCDPLLSEKRRNIPHEHDPREEEQGIWIFNVWGGIFGNFKTPLVRLQGR